jgi:sulfur carrier protein
MPEPRTSETLEIRLNGEAYAVAPGATLATLLESLGKHPRMVAIELNGDIVRRDAYGATELSAGDQVEVVHFVQGG